MVSIFKIIPMLIIAIFITIVLFAIATLTQFPIIPTPEFKDLDINNDGEISRLEFSYKKLLMSNINSIEIQIFNSEDCNKNGRLSWWEYSIQWRSDERCSTVLYPSLYRSLESNNDPFPIILSNTEIIKLNGLKGEIANGLLPSAMIPSNIMEQDVSDEKLKESNIYCLDKSYINPYSYFEGKLFEKSWAYYLNGYSQPYDPLIVIPLVSCTIENLMEDLVMTLLVVEIEEFRGNQRMSSTHLKPVYIPPFQAESFTILFNKDVVPGNIQLKLFRVDQYY